jgi:hypothetical protein
MLATVTLPQADAAPAAGSATAGDAARSPQADKATPAATTTADNKKERFMEDSWHVKKLSLQGQTTRGHGRRTQRTEVMRPPLNSRQAHIICAKYICCNVYVIKKANKQQCGLIRYFFVMDIPAILVRMPSPECPTI